MIFQDETSALAAEAALSIAMAEMAPPGVALACRLIRPGDENRLLPEESRSISARQPAARRASGAARSAARTLFSSRGITGAVIPRAASGEPLWPAGFSGSLAHDEQMAVAALSAGIAAIGIDVEPAEPLPPEIAAVVRTPGDVTGGIDPTLADRLLFSAKEAVYKASFPLDRQILGYEHIAVDLANAKGVTSLGRRARLSWCLAPRVVVLAIGEADAGADR